MSHYLLKVTLRSHLPISLLPLAFCCLSSIIKTICLRQELYPLLLENFEIYDNYFAFLFLIIVSNIIIKVAQQMIVSKPKNLIKCWDFDANKYSFSSFKNQKKIFLKAFKALLSYTLIFLAYQIIGSFIDSRSSFNGYPMIISTTTLESPQELINLHSQQDKDSPIILTNRILQEGEQETLNNETPMNHEEEEKINFAMGQIKSILKLDLKAMILSKDQKLAFAMIRYAFIVKVIDISDLESPKAIGSIGSELRDFSPESQIPALQLSSDEKTLFVSTFVRLRIINVTNPTAPVDISFTESVSKMGSKPYKTSLILDEKTSTLLIGGLGLLVFDISNLATPTIVKLITNPQDKDYILQSNEIKLSHDRTVLFMANNTLDIYNISNPREIQLIFSLNTTSSANSLTLVHDPKRILLLGTSSNQGLLIDEVDVSNYSSPSIIKSHQPGSPTAQAAHFHDAHSPGQTQYFIFAWKPRQQIGLLTFDDRTKLVTQNSETPIINTTYALQFIQDGKNLITLSNREFKVAEMFQNYPNRRIFGSKPNKLGNFSLSKECLAMKLSPDGKILFLVTGAPPSFEIWNVTDARSPYQLNSLPLPLNKPGDFKTFELSSNSSTAYIVHENQLTVLNISNPSSPSLIKTIQQSKEKLVTVSALSDGLTGIATVTYMGGNFATAFNLSDPSSQFQRFWTLPECRFESCRVALKDDHTLLVVDKEITIYDISNIQSSPVKVASLPIVINETKSTPLINSIRISSDRKILYVVMYDEYARLQVYNLSALKAPYLVSEKTFYKAQISGEGRLFRDLFTFTSDLQTGFTWLFGALFKVKLSDFNNDDVEKIFFHDKTDSIVSYIISPDAQTIYSNSRRDKTITIVSIRPQSTLFLKQEKFLLGRRYSDQVRILQQTPDYSPLDQTSYKIIKLSFFDIKFIQSEYRPEISEPLLPSWIEFDNRNNLLTLAPEKQNNLGTYTLQSFVSLKISDDAFNSLGVSSEDLIAWLVSLDYINNQLFLTESFASIESQYSSTGSLKAFYLPAQFIPIKDKIYDILKNFYFKTYTGIEVLSSLELQNDLVISTPSSDNIKVDINLRSPPESNTLFLHKSYAPLSSVVIENKPKPRLHFEGNLKDINAALQSVVVNFAAENSTNCDATFTIQDGLNRPLTVPLTNVANLFIKNQPPSLNETTLTVQQQINTIDIYTGQQFTLDFDAYTFTDNHSDSLTYELALANGKEAPKWLTLTGLKLRGSPPEEVLEDIQLVIIAKNEFKQTKEPFKIQVKLSLSFILKQILKYGGTILTALGVTISVNSFLNIFGKSWYKHAKEYVLNSGEKLTPETIFPIFFVNKEKQETSYIMKHLQKFISFKKQTYAVTRSAFLNYYMDSTGKELQKQKILDDIQGIVSRLPIAEKRDLIKYLSDPAKKPRIQQLVIDQISLWQLDQDLETKSMFEKIKDKWADMIYYDSSDSKFALDQSKFAKVLQNQLSISNPAVYKPWQSSSEESLLTDDSSLTFSGINLSLLQDAILAYAFEQHQIDEPAHRVEVSTKLQVSSNFLMRFLKRDLQSPGKIDFGFSSKLCNDILNFTGTPEISLQGRTLVVQIATTRSLILKEIWIRGTPNPLVNPDSMEADMTDVTVTSNLNDFLPL